MTKKIDVFPAIILLAPPDSLQNYTDLLFEQNKPQETRRVDRCRVAIVNGKIYVAVDAPDGPKLVFREDVADHTKIDNQYNAITTSGKILAFRKDNNCGCGSRLRSWNPFGSYLSSTEDPDA